MRAWSRSRRRSGTTVLEGSDTETLASTPMRRRPHISEASAWVRADKAQRRPRPGRRSRLAATGSLEAARVPAGLRDMRPPQRPGACRRTRPDTARVSALPCRPRFRPTRPGAEFAFGDDDFDRVRAPDPIAVPDRPARRQSGRWSTNRLSRRLHANPAPARSAPTWVAGARAPAADRSGRSS